MPFALQYPADEHGVEQAVLWTSTSARSPDATSRPACEESGSESQKTTRAPLAVNVARVRDDRTNDLALALSVWLRPTCRGESSSKSGKE